MKFLLTAIIFLNFLTDLSAQRISKITISTEGALQMFSITTDDNAVINVNPNGEVINYGTEYFSENIQNFSRVEKFNGRVDLFGSTDDKAFQGKLKYIGRTAVTYYASYDIEALRGKIKSIGNLVINYFMDFDDSSIKGKIKNIGSTQLQYFTSFDNESLRGKLKNVGNTNLSYYNSFEDQSIRGKIKSIGQASFTYYTSFEKQFAGAMKTGNQNQNISGINYIIQ